MLELVIGGSTPCVIPSMLFLSLVLFLGRFSTESILLRGPKAGEAGVTFFDEISMYF